MIEPVDRVSALGDRLGLHRFDVVLVGVVALMSAITLATMIDPSLNRIIVDRTLDVALSSLGLLAAVVLSALAMLRYRESGRVSALLQASAFLTLGILDAVVIALVLDKLDGRVGLTLGMPEQLPLYVTATVWLTVAGVLAASGLSALREARGRAAHARWLVLAPPLVIIALTLVVYPERRPAALAHRRRWAQAADLGAGPRSAAARDHVARLRAGRCHRDAVRDRRAALPHLVRAKRTRRRRLPLGGTDRGGVLGDPAGPLPGRLHRPRDRRPLHALPGAPGPGRSASTPSSVPTCGHFARPTRSSIACG